MNAPRCRPGLRGSASGRRADELGQETLQAVLVVALILLPVLVSIITFGSMIHTYIGAQAAAAAGARAAGASGGFGAPEFQRVDEELHANGIDAGTCQVDTSTVSASLDQPIAVSVSCPQHVGIPFLFERDVPMQSTFVAHSEVNR